MENNHIKQSTGLHPNQLSIFDLPKTPDLFTSKRRIGQRGIGLITKEELLTIRDIANKPCWRWIEYKHSKERIEEINLSVRRKTRDWYEKPNVWIKNGTYAEQFAEALPDLIELLEMELELQNKTLPMYQNDKWQHHKELITNLLTVIETEKRLCSTTKP
jgi:hypothetical protein